MKPTLIITGVLVISIATALGISALSTDTEKLALTCDSPEFKLSRYLLKMDRMKNDKSFNESQFVRQVKDKDGNLDLNLVKPFLIERGIIKDAQEFDTAMSHIKSSGILDQNAKPIATAQEWIDVEQNCSAYRETQRPVPVIVPTSTANEQPVIN